MAPRPRRTCSSSRRTGRVAYSGAIDDDRSADRLGDENYVLSALQALLGGETVDPSETPPYGCSVKY